MDDTNLDDLLDALREISSASDPDSDDDREANTDDQDDDEDSETCRDEEGEDGEQDDGVDNDEGVYSDNTAKLKRLNRKLLTRVLTPEDQAYFLTKDLAILRGNRSSLDER